MKINKTKGQALLFVVVAMTIALTVGVSITSRTISSLRRTSSTDTAARVFSAAEGGIEWFLRQPVSVLDKLADGDNNGGGDCPNGTSKGTAASCIVVYAPQVGDHIQSYADVNVEKFQYNAVNAGNGYYWFDVNTGDVKEIALRDYSTGAYYNGTLDLCWKSLDNAQSAALYYSIYSANGVIEKRIVTPFGAIVGDPITVKGQVASNAGRLEYSSCTTISIDSSKFEKGLRVKALYAPIKAAAFPTSGFFPTQGFKVTSLGQLDNVAEKIKATKEITVYRSLPYTPSSFDYAIYSNEPID